MSTRKPNQETRTNVFLIVGPSGVGKSTIGVDLKAISDLVVFDLDSVYTQKYGDIARKGYEEGWYGFFESQSSLFREMFQECLENRSPTVIVTGTGTLFHPEFRSISNQNYRLVAGRCCIIFVLPSMSPVEGSKTAAYRQQLTRKYPVNAHMKRNQYYAQLKFLEEVADYTVLNVEVRRASLEIISIIKKHAIRISNA